MQQLLCRPFTPEENIIPASSRHWDWRVPAKPDRYLLKIANVGHQRTMSLNVFVMVPFDRIKGDYLDGSQ